MQGVWWLPGSKDRQQVGTLTFDQIEGGRLSTIGHLAPLDVGPFGGVDKYDVVHGITVSGKYVTLINVLNLKTNLSLPGLATEVWRIHIVAIGAHFLSDEENLFKRGWTKFDGLAEWLEHNPFKVSHDLDSLTTELVAKKPEKIDLGRIPGASVYSGATISSNRDGNEAWVFATEAMIAIDADEPKSLTWYFNASSKLQALAEMLFGRSLHLRRLRLDLPIEQAVAGRSQSVEVEIYAQLIGGDVELPPVDRPPMLTMPALLNAAPNALSDWFAQYENLSASLHLLSTVVSDRRMFINVRFLLAAQAVETFHREAYPGTIVTDDEHAEIVKALKEAIPLGTGKDMREKLKSSLLYSNEPSLRQRLRSLIGTARSGRTGVMPAYDKAFINAVVDTRNYETHHGQRPANILEDIDIHWAIQRLIVLLTAHFLQRLGLKPDAIDAVISRHREFHNLWTTAGTP